MKWTTLVHVLIEKLTCLIEGVSKLAFLVQVLVQLLEQVTEGGTITFGGSVKYDEPDTADAVASQEKRKSRRGTIPISELELAEGEWLMDTVEACAILGISRVTLGVRRDEGLLSKVTIGKKGGGVRYISTEIMEMRQWYSVPKGKV